MTTLLPYKYTCGPIFYSSYIFKIFPFTFNQIHFNCTNMLTIYLKYGNIFWSILRKFDMFSLSECRNRYEVVTMSWYAVCCIKRYAVAHIDFCAIEYSLGDTPTALKHGDEACLHIWHLTWNLYIVTPNLWCEMLTAWENSFKFII